MGARSRRRFADPSEIADAIAYLQATSFLRQRHGLIVDGGLLSRAIVSLTTLVAKQLQHLIWPYPA